MRVFLTGATGFIGTAVTKELLAAGHNVVGLTRSEAGAEALSALGAEPHRGDLDDDDSLRRGVASADSVIHTAFNHDFSKFAASCEADRRVITLLGAELSGSDRPLIVTSGVAIVRAQDGRVPNETDPVLDSDIIPRAASEEAARAVAHMGVNVSIVRLPQVHDPKKQGLITFLIEIAREKRFAAYVGDGSAAWAAAHISDVARLYRLALEKREAGATYHAVAEEGVALREITARIGRGLNVPVRGISEAEVPEYFGALSHFAASDLRASSAQTRQHLNWQPVGPGLIEDLELLQFA